MFFANATTVINLYICSYRLMDDVSLFYLIDIVFYGFGIEFILNIAPHFAV